MYVSEFIKLVRQDVGDGVAEYRWSDQDMLDKINVARCFLFGKRPAAFCVSTIATEEPLPFTEANLRSSLDVLGLFVPPLQSYVAYLLLREDVDDAASQTLAMNFFEAFKIQV